MCFFTDLSIPLLGQSNLIWHVGWERVKNVSQNTINSARLTKICLSLTRTVRTTALPSIKHRRINSSVRQLMQHSRAVQWCYAHHRRTRGRCAGSTITTCCSLPARVTKAFAKTREVEIKACILRRIWLGVISLARIDTSRLSATPGRIAVVTKVRKCQNEST